MKSTFTCAVRQQDSIVRWTHVTAEDTRVAVRLAVEQAKVKGHCAVDVYRGKSVPMDPDEAPAATATLIA